MNHMRPFLRTLTLLPLLLCVLVPAYGQTFLPAFSNFGGGSGAENDPFLITNLEQFNNLRTLPAVPVGNTTANRHFRLTTDLDLSSEASGEGWVPINVTHITLDGNGHTIRNLTINRQNAQNQGLFGVASRVNLSDLTVRDASIVVGASASNQTSSGIVAGNFSSATVTNLTVHGTVRAADGAIAEMIGGVFGVVVSTTITQLTTDVEVHGTTRIGGVAGHFQSSVALNHGRIRATLSATGLEAGGVAGLGAISQVLDTVTDVDITAHGRMGGVFGEGHSYTIRRVMAYFRFVYPGTGTTQDNGGLVGFNTNTGSAVIDNVYTEGSITGDDRWTGGIIGNGTNSVNISRAITRFEKTGVFEFAFACIIGRGLDSNRMQHAYFDNSKCTVSPAPGELSRSPEQLRTSATYHFSFFDTGTPWVQSAGINDGIPYISNLPLRASVAITAQAGWRMMSSPAAVSYARLLGPVWTQGAVGSNAPAFPESNVFTMQADVGDGTLWAPVTDLNTTLTPGRGFIYFHFNDDNNDGTANTTATSLGMLVDMPQDPIRIDASGQGNGDIDDWMLLGNPYNATIRFSELEMRETSNVMYIYTNSGADVTADGASNPQYIAWNEDLRDGSATNGLIAPFQGFLVWAESSDAYVEFSTSSIVSDVAGLRQRERSSRSLSLQLEGEQRTNRTHFTFGHDGDLGADRKDAMLLQPMASTWLSLFSMLDDQPMDIQHLPYQPEGVIDLPLGIRHLQSGVEAGGTFTLGLAAAHNIPDDWELLLRNQLTGEVIDLRSERADILHEPVAIRGKSSTNRGNPLVMEAGAEDGSAYVLRIVPSPTPTSVELASDLPADVQLDQNFPNPFNPTTTLRYALPESGEVRLEVFALTGQRVAVLAEGVRQAGWHSVTFDGGHLSSGVYVYRLTAGGQIHTRKLTLIK